ncbi:maleylpyruvate isomerase family mycothiol-dependent enzyme [Planotetraspora phitsanulokensis]|uniref:Maleylpyruvate isomerase n=1 Tax=Planotetraspora phitsanulokensis TaxID=575192 RepID=A0A8J3UBZ3_9ACTN|nr:maleylpyruvate isomerase family mycothiol-dependent enzyme [Planotetraspora phitsanulokensis]GII41756.1 maleylpyruvate isomerase [Planotetraspora phitsanulokensis]
MSAVEELQTELAESTSRLLATAARLTDDDVRAPSLLPGWTRGHVLTHLARNADSHVNLLTWARTGVRTPQYSGQGVRETEIEAGAVRPVKELLADLEDSADRLREAVEGMPSEAWSATVSGIRPPEHPAWYIPARRLRELEIHHVDLGAGYGWADWPDTYVRRELHDTMASWPRGEGPVSEIVARWEDGGQARVWHGLGRGPAVHGSPRELVAWLTGRASGEGLTVEPSPAGAAGLPPSPPPWLVMPAPPDLPARPPRTWPPDRD